MAVQEIHDNRIMHRDIKPNNILCFPDGRIKLADFGLARLYSPGRRMYSLTVFALPYRPPEVVLGVENYTPKVDMWGVGVVMYELLEGRMMFYHESPLDLIYHIFELFGKPDSSVFPDITDTLDQIPPFPPNHDKLRRRTPHFSD
jgi:serine/threonine protein kinase